jgi:hypothetical protein
MGVGPGEHCPGLQTRRTGLRMGSRWYVLRTQRFGDIPIGRSTFINSRYARGRRGFLSVRASARSLWFISERVPPVRVERGRRGFVRVPAASRAWKCPTSWASSRGTSSMARYAILGSSQRGDDLWRDLFYQGLPAHPHPPVSALDDRRAQRSANLGEITSVWNGSSTSIISGDAIVLVACGPRSITRPRPARPYNAVLDDPGRSSEHEG